MADVHDVLLLWFDILGLCLPPLLFVSPFKYKDKKPIFLLTIIVSFASHINSMRYSRMLEESSFANRKADYFWLLFLSSLMLLVRLPSPDQPFHSISSPIFLFSSPGPIPTLQPPFSLFPTRLRAHLLLVPPTSLNAHLALRTAHHHSTLSSLCPRRLLLGDHWHVARRGERSRRMCSRSRRMVHP